MKRHFIKKMSGVLFSCVIFYFCVSCEPDIIKNSMDYKMILVNPGTFKMGGDYGKTYEKPIHEVTITKSFYIGVYEVTFAEYEMYTTETGKEMPAKLDWVKENSPIVYISWFDAIEYCNWLSKKEGLPLCYTMNDDEIVCNFDVDGYRLPTEAEWNWAARGAEKSKGYKYSGSNDPQEVGWNKDNPWFVDKDGKNTHVIGKKSPNEIGLYDMSGNAWEWCYDWRGDYLPEPQTDPIGPNIGETRILRGGSWEDYITCMRLTNRYYCNPEHNFLPTGIRYVRTKIMDKSET